MSINKETYVNRIKKWGIRENEIVQKTLIYIDKYIKILSGVWERHRESRSSKIKG